MGLPAKNGTYALVLKASAGTEIQVGHLGRLYTKPGFYVYVGSAHGPGGLAARVGRHQQAEKKLRWQVDYLREVTDLVEIWYVISGERLECG